jgi:methyl-accepting chemotaxis protein
VLLLVLVLFSGSLFYSFANKELTGEYYKAHSTLKNVMDNLLPWLLGVNILGILIASVLTVFFTHRVAGPIFRIQKDLNLISEGKLNTRIKIRRKDHFHEIKDGINNFLVNFDLKLNEMKKEICSLRINVQKFEEISREKTGNYPELQNLLDDIKKCESNLNGILSFFHSD